MKKLFRKHKKPEAVVFVDYEHWHVSLYKKYSMRPQIRAWKDSLAKDYEIRDIYFFGDFSNQGMKYEIPKIREVTNNVIETQNTSPFYKKDFTDFIMLDYIYQQAIEKNSPDTFIIFTGDGHFSSVVKFLVNNRKKNVVIYAVKDSLSGMLRNAASQCIELPTDEQIELHYYAMLSSLIMPKKNEKGRDIFPTFVPTVSAAAEKFKLEKDFVKVKLEEMIAKGYVVQQYKTIGWHKHIKILALDKEKLEENGIPLPQENN